MHTPQFCCGGLNFGTFYDRSPIVAYDGEAAPAYTMDDFTPSTVPGCRTPHVWLEEGRSLYDAMGPGFTLLRFDRRIEVEPLEAPPARAGCRSRCSRASSRRTAARLPAEAGAVPPRPARRLAR